MTLVVSVDTLTESEKLMDRESLLSILRKGPVTIRMNDGSEFAVPSIEHALVDDIAAAVLYQADDGKWRTVHLPLVTMAAVHPLAEAS